MGTKHGYPSHTAYQKYFGTWNNALIVAGLTLHNNIHKYDGTESCSMCGSTNTCKWRYHNNNLVCMSCYSKVYNINNPSIYKLKIHKRNSNRRGYQVLPLNKKFNGSEGHHLWLENRSDWVVFIPEFLHKLHYHNHNNIATLTTVNAIAIDYLINEEFYLTLYS